jgi:hypothetical protein
LGEGAAQVTDAASGSALDLSGVCVDGPCPSGYWAPDGVGADGCAYAWCVPIEPIDLAGADLGCPATQPQPGDPCGSPYPQCQYGNIVCECGIETDVFSCNPGG